MNETFDRLIIRIILVFFVAFIFLAFKYLHYIFYPVAKRQVTKPIDAMGNPSEVLHLFSRILGLSIVISSLSFDESNGFFLTIFHFLVWSVMGSITYLISIFLSESIILYHFEYKEEILKKNNFAYAIVSFVHAFSISLILRQIIRHSENSFIIFLGIWLISLVVIGFSGKYYNFITRLSLSNIINQKNINMSFSYLGYSLGFTFLFTECLNQDHYDIALYSIQILLKILLCLIIFPIFKQLFQYLFELKKSTLDHLNSHLHPTQSLGIGLYDGFLYFISAILTSIIVNQINFGTIYPFF